MSRIKLAIRLAARDWVYERLLSLCAVLALASMLTPLLVLQGVKNGVVESLREKLLEDPEVLIITPVGGGEKGSFSPQFIEEMRSFAGTKFVIGRIRDSATDMSLYSQNGVSLMVQMEPCAKGEPALEHYAMPTPQAGAAPELVLSRPAASKLGLQAGDTVEARLGRKTPHGNLESVVLPLKVVGILPLEASGRNIGFLPLSLLEDVQDYRDFIAVHARGYSGNPRGPEPRQYESFRLYANDLNSVEQLAARLNTLHVETRTKAREIASIRAIDASISSVILIIAAAVAAGFVAFTLSSVQANVRRKDKMLGMLRLLGFSQGALLSYPMTQTLLTGVCGSGLAGLLYCGVSYGIDSLFASQSGGVALCRLGLMQYSAAVGLVLVLSVLAALRASAQAARIEPSSVIREM